MDPRLRGDDSATREDDKATRKKQRIDSMKKFLLLNPRLIQLFFLGIASGLPLALTGSTLQAWYSTSSHVGLVAIGALALVGQPYVYKFLWAPFFDRYTLPFLGRRRGWMLLMQGLLALMIFIMAFFDPATHPLSLAFLAVGVAFLSASQDISIDAYRTDILGEQERGLGAAYGTGGYRVGMLISGSLAFVMAQYIGWNHTYEWMSLLMVLSMGVTLLSKEPEIFQAPSSLYVAMVEPLFSFFRRPHAFALLAFVILYKLSDALAMSLNTPFLLQGMHFSLAEVGVVYKTVGMGASFLGIFVGGALMLRWGLFNSLFYFGILQGASSLLFMVLAIIGKHWWFLLVAVFGENLFSGMGSAAFVALLMGLCDKRYTATQFALLSALAATGRVFVGPLAGILAETFGWPSFYILSALAALPGLVMLGWLSSRREEWSYSVSQ